MSTEELKEVLSYLKHSNTPVQQEACKILTQLCFSPSTLSSLASLDPIPSLLPLVSSPPPLQSTALTLLLLLSTSDPFLPLLLTHPTISILIELLRSTPPPPSPPPSYLPSTLSLLVNLTRTEAGAGQLMQEGTALEGLHMRRLLSWFLLPPTPSDSYELIASILLNVSQLPSGRTWLLSPSSGALRALAPFLLSGNEGRQRAVLTLFRNLFLESASHPILLSPTLPILQNLLLLIAGEGEVREEEREGFFPAVLQAMTPSHPRHSDPAIRRMCLEVILLCARERKSREYLKERRVYVVLRELHQRYEKGESGDKELDEFCYDIVPYFILPEDDEYERETSRKQPRQSPPPVEAKRRGEGEGEERKERPYRPPQPLPLPQWNGEVKDGGRGEKGDEEEEVDEKTAALLDDLSIASKAIEGNVQQRRAEREAVERDSREKREAVHRQMEERERVDESVEGAGEEGEDDDLPDLIEEAAVSGSIDSMD